MQLFFFVFQYVVHRQGLDHDAVGDVKALEKGKLVAEECITALSSFKDDSLTFLSGIVNASMKKRITYSVKVILEESGEVRNSHCECAGGMGPHGTCKHIVALLMVVIDFRNTGQINISKCCTETLQSFHKPRQLHSGSPVKAEQLGPKLLETDNDDPRPPCMRNQQQYTSEVMMKMINFTFASGLDVSLRYMGGKADLKAAAQDHDYLEQDFRTY